MGLRIDRFTESRVLRPWPSKLPSRLTVSGLTVPIRYVFMSTSLTANTKFGRCPGRESLVSSFNTQHRGMHSRRPSRAPRPPATCCINLRALPFNATPLAMNDGAKGSTSDVCRRQSGVVNRCKRHSYGHIPADGWPPAAACPSGDVHAATVTGNSQPGGGRGR